MGEVSVHETSHFQVQKERGVEGTGNFGSHTTVCHSQQWCLHQREWSTIFAVQVVTYALTIDFKLTCVAQAPL
jgi:hypothetical protein